MADAQAIFSHLIENYPIRFDKNQKVRFLSYAENFAGRLSFARDTDKQGNNNLIIGDLNTSHFIITAHYDTPPSHKRPLISGVTKNFLKAVKYDFNAFTSHLSAAAKPNINNYNDNSSGVCALLALLSLNLPKTAFVFFDNEEKGLSGSKSFAKRYKQLTDGRLIINLDCIGCGDYTGIIHYTYYNEFYAENILRFFPDNAFKMLPVNNFATDALNFSKSVTLSAFDKIGDCYQFGGIHTQQDNKVNFNNIDTVINSLHNYIITEE